MSLSVNLITNAELLSPDDLDTWNRLAKNPLQRWEWLGSWWQAYQGEYALNILKVCREGKVIAFAPWCIENRVGTGRTIQFLGSGKACTDHLSLLLHPRDTDEVCDAISQWLSDQSGVSQHQTSSPAWDRIELIGVDQQDGPVNCLAQSMRNRGLDVDQAPGMGCYVIDLPPSWDDYVQMRSKSGRREIRQSLKQIDHGTILVEKIRDQQQLDDFWDDFVSLHQRRRHASGTTGCFDHPPFGTFLRMAASRLLESGLLEFVVASVHQVPVAAQFAIADDDGWYFYQSGMDPQAAELRPGLSVFCYAIRESILSGKTRFDMLRGDEPYKLRWRAKLVPSQEVRVCSPRLSAQVRKHVYNAGLTFKNLVKSNFSIGQQQH